jgi:hypothetical protein
VLGAVALPRLHEPRAVHCYRANGIKSEGAEHLSFLDDIVNDVIRPMMIVNAAFSACRGAARQALRWTATGLLEAQTEFRRVKGYQELGALQHRLNP